MNETTFYMPPEWHDHRGTIVEWPMKASLCWPENHELVKQVYAEVVKAIAEFEPVLLIVTEETIEEAKAYVKDAATLVAIPHNDGWVRDNGPTFVINEMNEIRGISWDFNAWGEKYLPYDLDNRVAQEILANLNIPMEEVQMVMEGGSIHVDGEGTLLSTKECLLNPNRNPDLSVEDIERILKQVLRVDKIIWLNQGLFGDETDGHVDNIACFVKPGTILIQTCHDPEDPNYAITCENLEILRNARDAQDRSLNIIEMPQPPIRYYQEERLTLSYLNFYFVNKGILLPVFGGEASEADQEAIRILSELFPDRTIVPIMSLELIKEGGNIHCITQQIPSVKPIK